MGNHKYIKTPEKMWKLFEEYRKQVKSNPRTKVEYVGRNGDRVETPLEVPLTIEGFKNYCRKHESEIHHYWNNTGGAYDEFRTIITCIREEIRQDQLEGGMVGQYNSNLTARMNGLTDKKEHEVKTEQPLFGNPTQTS